MFEQLQPVIQDAVVTTATVLLSILSAFLIAVAKQAFTWFEERIVTIKDARAQEVVRNAKDDLHEIVNTTVRSIQKTLADDIKESIKNDEGKYTREDLCALANKAYNNIMGQLSLSSKAALIGVYNDLEGYVKDLIEAKLNEMKNEVKFPQFDIVDTAEVEAPVEKKLLNE